MVTINLPAVDSDVNVFVTVMNVFGTGDNSNVLMDDISELPTCTHSYLLYTYLYDRVAKWLAYKTKIILYTCKGMLIVSAYNTLKTKF